MAGNHEAASAPQTISVSRSAWRWWKNLAARDGRVAATRQLLTALFEFVRDSTPERRRQHYGDAGYDWDHRVNTHQRCGWLARSLAGSFPFAVSADRSRFIPRNDRGSVGGSSLWFL